MGILDDLKKQADEARVNKESAADRQARLEANYRQEIRPKLIAIARYLYDMVKQLKVVELEVPVIYKMPGLGSEELSQKPFTINIDNNNEPKKLGLQMECVSPVQKTYAIHSVESANEVREFLDKQGVQYTEWAIRDKDNRVCGANFEGQLKVKVRILFQANLKENRIDMSTANFEGIGTKKLSFTLSQINDDWLDELGHYLLRKEAKLGTLDIAEHEKEMIKTQFINYEEERRKELERLEECSESKEEKLLSALQKTLNKPLW